jgi:D-glycero-D-manno-heptose 1,7-bisphosphate phosphatase
MNTTPPAVILAGGLGTRLGQIGEGKPKALVEIEGKPFLDWKLNELVKQGVPCIYILTGHKGEQIYEFVSGKDYSIPICLISDGVTQLGTAGALLRSLAAISSQHFILTYGDNLLELEIADFCETARKLDSSLMVVTSNVGEADVPNSIVEDGQISKYSKGGGGEMKFIDYGYSVLRKSDLADTAFLKQSDLSQVFTKLASERKLAAYVTSMGYAEIGTPRTLEKTEEWLKLRNSED